MTKVKQGQLKMKPRWLIAIASIFSLAGLVGLGMILVFFINLSIFIISRQGRFCQWKLDQILSTFPIWLPFLIISVFILGLWLLKKYDFSYQKNFRLIVFIIVISLVISAFLVDKLGLNEVLSRGRFQRFYQHLNISQPSRQFKRLD